MLTFSKFSCYPNPSNSQFILETFDKEIERFTVSDMNGRLILNQTVNAKHLTFGNELQSGVYLLSVFKEEQRKQV